MNKKVIAVFILTLLALAWLAFYSFGPLSNKIKQTQTNPVSLQPTMMTPSMKIYNNRDVKENYYLLQIPQTWQVQAGQRGGSYVMIFPSGSASVVLQDVPDNSTLELFVLSQEEPRLKQSLMNYQRISYLKININGIEAYQLIYLNTQNGVVYKTEKTYITGPDQAAVITFTAKATDFDNNETLFSPVLNSFKWKNQ